MGERNYQFNLGSWDITADDFDDAKRYLLDDLAEYVDDSYLARDEEPDTTLLGAAKAFRAALPEPKTKKRLALWAALGDAITAAEKRLADRPKGSVTIALTQEQHSTVLAALRRKGSTKSRRARATMTR